MKLNNIPNLKFLCLLNLER